MLVVLEEAVHVCEAPHSWEGGQPPQVPPHPSSPQVLPVQSGVQLRAPPEDPDDDMLPEVAPLEVALPDDEAPELASSEPPLVAPPLWPLDVPPELELVPPDPVEDPPSILCPDCWFDVAEQPTAPSQVAAPKTTTRFRMRITLAAMVVPARGLGATIALNMWDVPRERLQPSMSTHQNPLVR
jgi:hypothetical protein